VFFCRLQTYICSQVFEIAQYFSFECVDYLSLFLCIGWLSVCNVSHCAIYFRSRICQRISIDCLYLSITTPVLFLVLTMLRDSFVVRDAVYSMSYQWAALSLFSPILLCLVCVYCIRVFISWVVLYAMIIYILYYCKKLNSLKQLVRTTVAESHN